MRLSVESVIGLFKERGLIANPKSFRDCLLAAPRIISPYDASECVVGLRGLELRARHAVLSNRSPPSIGDALVFAAGEGSFCDLMAPIIVGWKKARVCR